MSGVEFENFMANVFDKKGYHVQTTPTTGDQGVDLLLTTNDRKVAVQLKRYTAPVGNAAVQAVFAGMFHYKAKEAWVITTSSFTKSAVELAESNRVRLTDGVELEDRLGDLRDEAQPRAKYGLMDGQDRTFDFSADFDPTSPTRRPVQELNTDAIQFVPTKYWEYGTTIDDMYATLGEFNLRVNMVFGSIKWGDKRCETCRKKYEIQLDRVAVYVDDAFEFNGFQPLGFWNAVNNTGSITTFDGGQAIFNSTYREWGEHHARGGDFRVFSDVKQDNLKKPIIIKGGKDSVPYQP